MAGVEIKLDVDFARVKERMSGLLRLTGDLEPFFKDVGEYLLPTIDKRFDQERSPDGVGWEDLKPATWARKKNLKILTEGTDLRGSMTYQAHTGELEVGTNMIYGATHQLGRPEAGIVARPYLGLSPADEIEIGTLLEEHLAG